MAIDEQQSFDTFSTLLQHGNIVKPSDLADAKGIAQDLNITLAKALIMSGMASDESISIALQAQSMVEKKTLSLDLAIRAIRLAVHNKHDLDKAVATLAGLHQKTQQVVSLTNELTALLLAAKLITSEQLGNAIKRSHETKTLIGHTLLLMGVITTPLLSSALSAVLMTRQKLLDNDKAAQGLRYANQRQIALEHALFELGFFSSPAPESMRLSELIFMAALLSQANVIECLELELFKQKQFGQILLEQGLISQNHLEAAFALQNCVASYTLKPFQAAAALRRATADNINVYQAISEAQFESAATEFWRLGDLLVDAQVCSRDVIERLIDENQEVPLKIGKILLAAGVVKESMLYNALRCQSLYRQGFFSKQQAIATLEYSQANDLTLDEACTALRSNVPCRMQWLWV
ncbi:hypothetical protein BH10CYA1_BH10CYA1_40310 [soil metagenome]